MASQSPPFPLLERLFEMLEETGSLRINIEDYLGVFANVPGLGIPIPRVYHKCSFCLFVRQTSKGYADCLANKRAVNRLLQRRKRPLGGLCHLGVADLVHPVVVEGMCVAGLFYGSVVIRERAAEARVRVRRYCRRRRLPAEEYLRELDRLPKVPARDLPAFRRRLETAAGPFSTQPFGPGGFWRFCLFWERCNVCAAICDSALLARPV